MFCCYCFLSDADIQNKKINNEIKRSKRDEGTKFKLLLLGTGESGKSTFIRQMQIIYKDGFTDEQRRDYIHSIKQNILNAMQTMVAAMRTLNIEYENKANKRNAEIIASADFDTFSCSLETYLLYIKELWQDGGIQECFRNRNKYQLIDSARYFIENVDRIAEPSYLPTDSDILNVRIKTTGLIDYFFRVEKVQFQITDVGGQRSERKKWMHCFDTVKAIIFLTAISEYDQVLRETDQLNRLTESRNVFHKISNSQWFHDTAIVVFFNKIDLLNEKIMYSDLDAYFPEFTGPKKNYEAAKDFIANMFLKDLPRQKTFKHFTCATDTNNIKVVFDVVRDSILSDNLNKIGLY
ncbi:guanine nucleotide-binding protein subunit alpha-11 [Musca domestica]|uniref:Guanine nucleotide-binding protein subunit alpha-11 n=1 Tax=Musca domestica TaxID=7370 RepID=A0A1I8NBL8_MUSDO|nr:guanine nucleotide-binding protein subunit alpha-11 [Musca domestica]